MVEKAGDGVEAAAPAPAECVDALLWIGESYYPRFFCGCDESCVEPRCFVHEAERRGVSREISHVPPWAVPGLTRIFLVHKGGHKAAHRARIFGYFVLGRVEVLRPSAGPAAAVVPAANKVPATKTAQRAREEELVRTKKCWNGKVIVTHRYDRRRSEWVRTREKCPKLPEPPGDCDDGDVHTRICADEGLVVTHVCVDGKWEATGAECSGGVPIEDEPLVDDRECGLRFDLGDEPGAVYLVDALAAEIADAFSASLDGESIRDRYEAASNEPPKARPAKRSAAVNDGRALFNKVVDEVGGAREPKARVPAALKGRATVRGEMVLFDEPPLLEKRPRVFFRGLTHIDGEHLLKQICRGELRPAVRSSHNRNGEGTMTDQQIVAKLAERTNANQAFTRRLLRALSELAQEELNGGRAFRIAHVGTFRLLKDGQVRFRASTALTEPDARAD